MLGNVISVVHSKRSSSKLEEKTLMVLAHCCHVLYLLSILVLVIADSYKTTRRNKTVKTSLCSTRQEKILCHMFSLQPFLYMEHSAFALKVGVGKKKKKKGMYCNF